MATAFPDTALMVDRDGGRESRMLVLVGSVLVAGWWAWAATATLPVTMTTSLARVESAAGSVRLAWEDAGVLVAIDAAPGAAVTRGTALARRDDSALRRAVSLARAELAALLSDSERLDAEFRSAGLADSRASAADEARIDSADIAAGRSRLALEAAIRAADRNRTLARDGLISASAAEKTEAEADLGRSDNDAAIAELLRVQLDTRAAATQREANAAVRQQRRAALELEIAAARIAVEAAEERLAGAVLRAPVDGTVGSVGDMGVGSFVPAGVPVVNLTPVGGVSIRARFEAADSILRLSAGQVGLLTVSGQTTRQEVPLTVVSVSPVPDGEGADVVLAATRPDARIPPGLVGEVEIETERTTPMALLAGLLGFPERPR